MRTASQTIAVAACLIVALHPALAGEALEDLSAPTSGDVWADVNERIVVEETVPTYDYPDDFYETPAESSRRRVGRWVVDFEGSLFQDRETGQILTTTGVDDKLMAFVQVGNFYYDWDGCLDVAILAAEAKYPSPFRGGEWLIVRDVLSTEEVPGRTKVGAPCLDWNRSRHFLDRE